MKDLTKTTPRSSSEMMLGVVQLARAIDKAKALTHGTIGEYKYDCPMDQPLRVPRHGLEGVPRTREQREERLRDRSLREEVRCQEGSAQYRGVQQEIPLRGSDRRIVDAFRRAA